MFDLINTTEFSKREIASSSNKIIECVQDGSIDVIELYIQMKRITEIMNNAMKDESVKQALIDRVEDYSKSDRSFHGVDIQLRKGIDKWDFRADPEWFHIQSEIDELLERKKLIEKALKANHAANRSSITEDGEIADNNNIICTPAQQTVAVKFK